MHYNIGRVISFLAILFSSVSVYTTGEITQPLDIFSSLKLKELIFLWEARLSFLSDSCLLFPLSVSLRLSPQEQYYRKIPDFLK